jgi:hypothetical protein
MEIGSLNEMVRREGFNSGSFRRFACDQSIYSVESRFAQKFRSRSFEPNSGIRFFIRVIDLLFVAIHVSNRDHSNKVSPNGERDKETPAPARLTERVVSLFLMRAEVAPTCAGLQTRCVALETSAMAELKSRAG